MPTHLKALLKILLLFVCLLVNALSISYAQEAEVPQPSTPSTAEADFSTLSLVDQIGDFLIHIQSDDLAVYPAEVLKAKKYLLLYFAGQWAPPCRTFTPALVEFYNNARKVHDAFEIIFISRDPSEQAMLEHLQANQMPWPAVRHSVIGSLPALHKYSGPAIPYLMLLDEQENVICDSFDYPPDKPPIYVGPERVVIQLGKKLLTNEL